jgi:arylformamidase
MKIFDVTLPLSPDIPVYPGDPEVSLERLAESGVQRLSLGTHAGTHVDAPAHAVAGGADVASLALEILMGKARVVDLPVAARIERSDLQALDLSDDLRVLLKTRQSGAGRRESLAEGVYLTEDAASYLVQAGLKLVGIDSLSVDRFGASDLPAHRALLSAGVVVVEGLDLAQVEPGDYDMACLPLRIPGADGAPARVVLRARR